MQRALAALALVALVGLALVPVPATAPPTDPPAEIEAFGDPTPGIYLALHLDEELERDRTVVWTAAFQAAWDELGERLGFEDGIPLLPPARPEAVAALNRGRLRPGVVDPRDLTLLSGPATQDTWGAIDKISALGRPGGAPDPSDEDVVAFARLRASLRYEVPFLPTTEPLTFYGPEGTDVRAWGIPDSFSGRDAKRMRDQVRIFVPHGTSDAGRVDRVVVVLTGAGGKRLVLSGRPAQRTLAETWADVRGVIRTGTTRELKSVDELLVPRIDLVAGRHYDEIASAEDPPFVEGTEFRLVLARQDVRLVVDEKGADVDAEAVLIAVGAIPLVLRYEGPFLVALLAPDQEMPFTLAWMGSADGLSSWDAPLGRVLSEEEARPYAGAWMLDRRASLDASLATWKRLLGGRDGPSSGLQGSLRDAIQHWKLRVEVHNGVAAVGEARWGDEVDEREVELRRAGRSDVLTLSRGEEGARETWTIRLEGDQLVLRLPSRGLTLVLRRR